MERLNALDQVFLAVESPESPWNIGALALFEGPAPTLEELVAELDGRLDRVARCRQRLRMPRGPVGRPVWIDDVAFDPARHVGLGPRVGGGLSLEEAVVAFLGAPLDRAHPLWAVQLVEGCGDGRWALISKVHHCMVDGIAGTDLLSTLLREAPGDGAAPPRTWRAVPEPTAGALARFAVASALSAGVTRTRSLVGALGRPRATGRRVVAVLGAARRLWLPPRRRATTLNAVEQSGWAWRRAELALDEVRRIGVLTGATVNDVVVAAVTRAMRELLLERGEPVAGRVVTALVPVSLRGPDEHALPDNRLANVHAELPVGVASPVEVVAAVHAQLEELKASHEVEATGLVMHLGEFVPRVVADAVARAIVTRQRKVEIVVTDVAGPTSPLALARRALVAGYPVAPVAGHVSFTIALWSYAGHLFVGVTGRAGAEPELERLASGIGRGLAELGAAIGPGGPVTP